MTTGQHLRKVLGLTNIPNARINRIAVSSVKTLVVWYDSNRSQMPITFYRIRRDPFAVMFFKGADLYHGKRQRAFMTPPVDLDDYNGNLINAVVITVDLSGSYKVNARMYNIDESINRSLYKIYSLKEFVTISDLQKSDVVSSTTRKFRKRRNKVMGTENTIAKPSDVKIDEDSNSVTFHFVVPATQDYPEDHKFKKDTKDFKLIDNPIEIYDLYFQFLDFFDWFEAAKVGKEKIEPKDMKELIEVSNVKVWSTSPSFHWQSHNYLLSQLDGSIYPTDIAPKKWDKIHGDYALLDKHLYGVVNQFSFFINPLASMLTLELKKEGYL